MRKLLFFSTFFLFICTTFSQNDKVFLSDALDAHLPKYLMEVETAIINQKQDTIKEIFNTLVAERLVGTYMNNISAYTLSKKSRQLADYDRPVLLITNPSWRINSKGEQPALNELARVYGDKVSIVMLFWGDKKTVRKLSKGYHRNVEILYVDDSDNEYTPIIKNLKHSLGLPLAFTLTGDKEVVNINHRFANKMAMPIEESSIENFNFYEGLIKKVVFEENKLSTVPTTVSLD